MRPSFFLRLCALGGALASASSLGCARLYSLDDYTTADGPSASSPSVDGGTTTKIDPGSDDAGAQSDGATGPACQHNVDCSADGSSVCVRATGTCVTLKSASCPRVVGDATSDDAVLFGTVLAHGDDPTGRALEQAAVLAAEEIDSPSGGGGLPPRSAGGAPRPVVVVSCERGSDVLDPTRHLVDELHVSAIVGPTSDEEVMESTQQVTVKGDTLVMTPTALASSIAQLGDDGLTWRNVPSESQRAKLAIQELSDLQSVITTTRRLTTVKLGVVYRNDPLGTSDRDSISGKLVVNGHFIDDPLNASNVSIDSYAPTDATSALAALATRYASSFVPDMIFLTAPEQVAELMVPVEQALTASRALYHPYYVCTEAAKTAALLDTIGSGSMPADLKRRIRGVGSRPDTSSQPVLTTFESAYAQRYADGTDATAGAPAYDALYAVALAVVASGDAVPTGASVERGLRALGVGDAHDVGPTDLGAVGQALAAGRSVSLRGTGSLMQWDSNGDIAGGTVEVWCVGGGAGAPTFGSSGLTMDVQTQVAAGAFVQCQ